MTDLSGEVRRRAAGLCEYCHIPEAAFRRPFHVEHVIARQHGGATELDNLALPAGRATSRRDPTLPALTAGPGQITPLFNPRSDRWADHFAFSVGTSSPRGIEILGLTAVGRTTVVVLGLNAEFRQMLRYQLWREGVKF